MTQQEWLVQVVVRSSAAEVDALAERMGQVVCSPADHEGPCATPWTMVTTSLADLSDEEQTGWRALLDEE